MDTRFYYILHCAFNFPRYEVSPRLRFPLTRRSLNILIRLYRRSLLLHFKLLPLTVYYHRYCGGIVSSKVDPRWQSCTKYLKTQPLVCDSILLIAMLLTTLSLSLLLNKLLIPFLFFLLQQIPRGSSLFFYDYSPVWENVIEMNRGRRYL